jgi:hypothetical protein
VSPSPTTITRCTMPSSFISAKCAIIEICI